MNCPNCDKEMKDKSYEANVFFGFGDEPDYYPTRLIEEYHCKYCKIRYQDGDWFIPENFRATEKQLNAGKIIEYNTGIDMPPPTKRLMWKYIQDNIELSKQRYEESKKAREQSFSEWCEENSDWLPEYF